MRAQRTAAPADASVGPWAYPVGVFNVGPEKVVLVLLIALIVLGPRELPDAARKMGNIVRELRRMSAGFEHELRSALDATVAESSPHRTPDLPVETQDGQRSTPRESDSAA